jgi:hypothetical protein
MKQLSAEEIQDQRELVLKMVRKNMDGVRRDRVLAMLEGKLGDEYFIAPGSSKLSFHDCFAGGLCYHSLNVFKNLRKIAEALCPGRWSPGKLLFCALFHDLGKAGDGERPYYVPNPSDWHREKLGKLYEINQECIQMPTSERGLWVLQLHGIEVDHEEYASIRLNDGMYPVENRPWGMYEPDLALLVHWADRWDARGEKS